MCGIAGFVGPGGERLARSMCAALAHRGPDDEGFHLAPGVALAMRRLAVIDLATGQQPMANESREIWVVFNGEIYNYSELRHGLKSRGHRFRSESDTETIVHLYEELGVDFVDALRGMFAIALWDGPRRRLVLARDRIGEKPLYYRRTASGLYFASEIKGLLPVMASRSADPQAVCDFLALGYIPGARTAFDGVAKLEPGHRLVYEDGRAVVERYWAPARGAAAPPLKEAIDETADRLADAVRACLKSDVEVGAFLSGGVDSSILVALMRRQAARVQTFTVGYEGAARGFNELSHAARVAARFDTDHHELLLGAQSTLDLVPRVLWHFDEPHGEPTSALVYELAGFTARHVKVAIGGTGGDEIFFGYPRHRAVRLLGYYRRLPKVVRRHLVERIVARWPESTTGNRFAKRARRFVAGADLTPDAAYLSWVRLLDREVHAALIGGSVKGLADDPAGDRVLRDHLFAGGGDLLDRAADLDTRAYLPDFQLTYMDRMSMAHGLEVRSPLCDYRLVEHALALPPQYRLRGLRSKHILKEIAARLLPREIVNRPKVGFDSPIGEWFRRDLRPFLDSFLAPDQIARTGLLDPDAVQRLVADHLARRRDYSLQLWSVIALEAWYRMYIEDRVSGAADCVLDRLRGAPRSRDAHLFAGRSGGATLDDRSTGRSMASA
ncbi:MAG: asparagine synthase (glutamine-hydrolyzing) [Acidobacteria bacterium]|nr:asparagine synthase (glutamine-hydrolyzing) [Acidobacteriota bacterium]